MCCFLLGYLGSPLIIDGVGSRKAGNQLRNSLKVRGVLLVVLPVLCLHLWALVAGNQLRICVCQLWEARCCDAG